MQLTGKFSMVLFQQWFPLLNSTEIEQQAHWTRLCSHTHFHFFVCERKSNIKRKAP
uniref:Uncharacterized protein n=1 Tax=Rhizophora mucronata TaxID=61149 RepID=A0A2P2PAK7_RHIMU